MSLPKELQKAVDACPDVSIERLEGLFEMAATLGPSDPRISKDAIVPLINPQLNWLSVLMSGLLWALHYQRQTEMLNARIKALEEQLINLKAEQGNVRW